LAALLAIYRKVPAGISTPPIVVGFFANRKSALDRALDPQAFLDKIRDETAILAKAFLEVGASPTDLEGVAEQSHRGFLPGGEQVGGDPGDIERLRHERSGKVAFASPERMSPLGCSGGLRYTPRRCCIAIPGVSAGLRHPSRRLSRLRALAPVVEVASGILFDPRVHAQQIGYDEYGERLSEVGHDLALSTEMKVSIC